jgi:hypothetical protein
MGYLVDTNVLSELRKKDRCDANVAAWLASVAPDELFVSVLSCIRGEPPLRVDECGNHRTRAFGIGGLHHFRQIQRIVGPKAMIR